MIIFCLIFSYKLWGLRGKSFDDLNPKQKGFVVNLLDKEYSFRRNRYTPETYHIRLQKMAVFLLIFGITLLLALIALFICIILFF